jgi:hypothetical protein
MPQPLPDAMVATLKADPCAALAAIMIISNAHSELLAWAQRTIGAFAPGDRENAEEARKPHGAFAPRSATGGKEDANANGAGVSNGAAKRHGAKKAARPPGPQARGHHAPREAAAKHDQALLALLQANPDASVTEIIEMNNRPRNSTMLSLERLEKAGLVEHASRGKWTPVDLDLLEAPAPKPAGWLEPLSGARVAKHAADGRVRDELTMAGGA